MISVSEGSTGQNIIGSGYKLVQWLFTVKDSSSNYYYWSTAGLLYTDSHGDFVQNESGVQESDDTQQDTGGDNQDGTLAFEFKITSFSGINLRRQSTEDFIISPSDVTFSASNAGNTLTASDFKGGIVSIALSVGEGTNTFIPRRHRFVVKSCNPVNQELVFKCEDYLQSKLRGYYPNTKYVSDLFPSSIPEYTREDSVCIPYPYGTCYIPLRPVYVDDSISWTGNATFVASSSGATCKITGANFEFLSNNSITVSGSVSNDGTYFVYPTATSTQLEISHLAGISNEGPVEVTITQSCNYYVLGDADTYTFTIHKVHSPRDVGQKSEWCSLSWAESDNGTNEYYATDKDGNNPYLDEPKDAQGNSRLLINGSSTTKGTVGSLNAGEWGYGTEVGIDFDTVYVRLSGGGSPSDESDNYVSVDYEFPQETQADDDGNNWRVFRAKIADADEDGTAEAYGFWRSGSYLHDMPTKFSRNDTVDMTDPADIIENILKDLGIDDDDIDADSFSDASDTFDGYTNPLEFNGAFWYKRRRKDIINELLVMCNSILISGEKIQFKILTKTSQATFHSGINLRSSTYKWTQSATDNKEYYVELAGAGGDPGIGRPFSLEIAGKTRKRGILGNLGENEWGYGDNDAAIDFDTIYVRMTGDADPDTFDAGYIKIPSDVMKTADKSPSTFRYTDITDEDADDAGYVAWQEVDRPQDNFNKILVRTGAFITNISSEVVNLSFLQNSRDAQTAAELYYRMQLTKQAEISLTAKATTLLLQPGDVVTIDDSAYGGEYDVIVDSMNIAYDCSIKFKLLKHSSAYYDWEDVYAITSAVTISDDEVGDVWQPSVSGPQSISSIARSSFEVWGKPYLIVGDTSNRGQFTDIQSAINALASSRHNGIHILNGTYELTSPIYLIDRDIEIRGESRGGVIIKNAAASDMFVLHNLTKVFKFSSFTCDSVTTEAYHDKFYIYGDTYSDNTASVTIKEIDFLLDDSSYGNHGITINKISSDGLVTVDDCLFDNAYIAISAYKDIYSSLKFKNSTFKNCQSCINSNAKTKLEIRDNIFTGIVGSVISLPGATGTFSITGNYVGSNPTTFISAYVACSNCTISNNKFYTVYSLPITPNAFFSIGGTGHTITKNTIDITSSGCDRKIYGVYTVINKSIIADNTITVDIPRYNGNGDNNIGLWINSDDNNIHDNIINMVNSDASYDYGIYFASSADDNHGGNNTTLNCSAGKGIYYE